MIRALLLAALAAGPAAAQDVIFAPAATEACLAATAPRDRADCIGLSAGACVADTPGGETTVGMGACLYSELQYWDDRLNAAYGTLRAAHAATDAEMRSAGGNPPSMADALRDMQRAWIPYRDAACAYARSQWGGGTGGGPASADCLMRLTGEQALRLERELEEISRR
ncbi:lysozyme inhibitor LprI family protein [Jannaschia ovalis]|uniref:DUF1311 domain-containing protein n=1 Tax=Jannaschia ovalis TaxID=3038773 RepID=A0ABY8L8K1_9RHOB|nr:DUF1311 domain-containing protein [Jannaschia sp. GRR-S6-38]WGH77631.1 DUF1311 domain-containing protein [Jannaschia sp. GRR-S6-38]